MVKQNLYLDINISMTVYVYIDKKILHVLNYTMPFTYFTPRLYLLEVVNGADCGRCAFVIMLLSSSLP